MADSMQMENVTADTLQVVVFSLIDAESKKKEDYGIQVESVREIRLLENITRVPNAPLHVRGLMNLRGKIISVIDVKKLLGFSVHEEMNENSRILIAEINGVLTGFLVDEVSDVLRISNKEVETDMSAELKAEQYFKGVVKMGEKLIILLDLHKLIIEKDDQSHEQTVIRAEA
ncbi:MAG: chemotaxis protein CheW [Thaumarchaeota archaeon]|nr:chemotaxis protein CheW [Nitrososphaerota archaeon]